MWRRRTNAAPTAPIPAGASTRGPTIPSYDQAEALIASLEGAAAAMLFASGQAAAGAVFQALAPGDCVLAPRRMYWALRKWLLEFAVPWGISVEFYENASLDDLAAKARMRRPRLIWIETPANPTWDITDIAAASEIGREVGAVVAVDSTAATPDAHAPDRARRADRDAFGDEVPERTFRRDCRRARERARRRVVATHPLRARRRRRRAGPVRSVAPAARHAHAAFARRRCVRERARDRATPDRRIRSSGTCSIRACRRTPDTPLPRSRCRADSAG